MEQKLRRGGYIADFSTTSDNNVYMLYTPPAADNTAALASTGTLPATHQGISGGSSRRRGGSKPNDDVELTNGFYYSMEGGCAACSLGSVAGGGRASKSRRGGVGLELAPFISALALLGARLLADKEIGIFNEPKAPASSSKKGGVRARR
jgi:hypothetical protein